MTNFSTEVKIGLAVIVALLLAITWFSSGKHGQPPAAALRSEEPPPFARAPQAGRAQERLSQLREERDGGDRHARVVQHLRKRAAAPQGQAEFRAPDNTAADNAEAEGAEDIADLDFEQLEQMALHDEDPDNRVAAVWLIASLDDEPVVPVLSKALSDSDPEVRLAAIQALSEFTDEAPIESLAMALEDSDPEIRFEALSIAAEIGDARVQPLITKAMDDPDEDVSSLAAGIADLEDTYHLEPGDQSPPAAAR